MFLFIATLLISFSGYFITKLPLSPVYICLIVGGGLYIFYFLLTLKLNTKSILPLSYFIFILVEQYFIHGDFDESQFLVLFV